MPEVPLAFADAMERQVLVMTRTTFWVRGF
jgi:hypothetical protein